ncbi:hypothetical protein ZWY2020_044909 [Hordeum vulgare]|nr:hypothetical protein ZWY2020_044909 [Hordeum vulgare]
MLLKRGTTAVAAAAAGSTTGAAVVVVVVAAVTAMAVGAGTTKGREAVMVEAAGRGQGYQGGGDGGGRGRGDGGRGQGRGYDGAGDGGRGRGRGYQQGGNDYGGRRGGNNYGGRRGRGGGAQKQPPPVFPQAGPLLSERYHAEAAQLREKFQAMDISRAEPTFPTRPGFDTIGQVCLVRANHFFVGLVDKGLHQYDVRSPRSSLAE